MKRLLLILSTLIFTAAYNSVYAQSEFEINGKEVSAEVYNEYESTNGEWQDVLTFCEMNIQSFPKGFYFKRIDGSIQYEMLNPISLDNYDYNVGISVEIPPYHREEVLKSVEQGKSFVIETWEDVLRYIHEIPVSKYPNPPVVLQNDKHGSYFHQKDK